MINTIVAH